MWIEITIRFETWYILLKQKECDNYLSYFQLYLLPLYILTYMTNRTVQSPLSSTHCRKLFSSTRLYPRGVDGIVLWCLAHSKTCYGNSNRAKRELIKRCYDIHCLRMLANWKTYVYHIISQTSVSGFKIHVSFDIFDMYYHIRYIITNEKLFFIRSRFSESKGPYDERS